MSKRIEVREKDGQFCAMEVSLTEHDGKTRLSICGVVGTVVTRKEAKKQALQYWESFFEDSPGEMRDMEERFDKCFRSANSAAKFVLTEDGEFHGLDVYREDDKKVFIGHSFGQIRDELREWFPEYAKFLKYHLNDLRPGPNGQSWEYECLPEEVVQWANNFGN